MGYEMIVGFNVADEKGFQDCLSAMVPLLKQYGGWIRYDFKISQVLKSESDPFINRVSSICFEDKGSKEGFFIDPDYKNIRDQFFTNAVKSLTIISEHDRDDRV